MAFIPTPLANPVIAPRVTTSMRSTPYISPSEWRFAPTSVATNALVAGSSSPATDSIASLAQTISRASGMIDTYVFGQNSGSFAANLTIESGWNKVKPDGTVGVQCNLFPILELVGIALGPTPSAIVSLDPGSAGDISIGTQTFTLPGSWSSGIVRPYFGQWPSVNGSLYMVWSYVACWPNAQLGASALAGATSITLTPPSPGGTQLYGIYPGTQLTIHDGSNTEVVGVAATPTGLTVSLSAPLAYSHTVPTAPDFVRVSAIPWDVEQATISLTSVLIKARGFRAEIVGQLGSQPSRKAAAQAGALEDYTLALELLHNYRAVYLH